MKKYEMMVIFKPNLKDEDLKKEEEKIKDYILNKGGEFINILPWGRKKFAYQIEKFTEGIYTIFYFKIPQTELKEFKQTLKLNTNILRFMIVKQEEKVNV
ncbi:MAG: 30S ribosomal protein S6 [Caldisericia bacterium]|nr:30S ribosomal protein S6 [Caldisericia bacterium]